jgi:hypothetical protein
MSAGPSHRIRFQAKEVPQEDRLALEHVEPVAAEGAALRDQHPLGAALGISTSRLKLYEALRTDLAKVVQLFWHRLQAGTRANSRSLD